MITTYTLTGKKIAGHIELQYTDGFLNAIKLAFKEQLNEDKFRLLFDTIAQREEGIEHLRRLGFDITQELASNEKLALFCKYYEQHKGIKYKVSAADTGKIKLIKLTDIMLTAYFESQNFMFKGRHSISNLVKYYNELLAEIAANGKSKHPDTFIKAYQDKLSQKALPEYWNHLRSLGFMPKKDRLGNVTDWVKNPS
jgi:hypothetical protein